MISQCNICSCTLRGYISGEFSSVYRATRPRRQQRQEEQNPTEQNRRAENRRNNHDNDSRGEGSLWRWRPGTATRGVVTFLDVLPGPAAAALFGFLLSVKCNAHVTTAPDPRKMPQSRQRRTASSFLIIFQSCPRRVWQVQLKSEAAPPLSVLFLLF